MHQKMSIGLKFRIKEVEDINCLCSENRDADQLRGDHEANLRLCSRICEKQVSHTAQLSINGDFLLHCGSFNAHKSGKNRVTRVMLSKV